MKTANNIITALLLSAIFGAAVATAFGPIFGLVITALTFGTSFMPIAQEGQLNSVCSLITAGLSPDCDNPLIAGVNDRLILFNKTQVSGVSYNVTNTEVIEALTLTSGAVGYAYQGQNFSNEPSSRAVVGRYAKRIEHQVDFLVFYEGNTAKAQLNKMLQGKFVAIVQNNFEGTSGDAAFTAYGIGQGLQVAEMEQLKYDQETLGAYRVSLKSHENALEAKLPNAVHITDFTTTKAMIDALL